MKKIAVIGGGAWGTVAGNRAHASSSRTHRLSLWAHSADVVETIQRAAHQ